MGSARRKGLGKGLSALIADPEEEGLEAGRAPEALSDGSELIQLDPREIRPNPKQPRRTFNEEQLLELAQSIRKDGMQEPVIVRQNNGEYQLVSGERRVRASVLAELVVIPAVLRTVSDTDMLRLGLIENIQREDLNPMELAAAYKDLSQTFDWTQDQLAEQVGKKRATVTNTMRLLNLPTRVQEHVISGDITGGHARALLALGSPAAQTRACRKIIENGLSVRQVEKLASRTDMPKPAAQPVKDPNVIAIEDDLRRSLGTRVKIKTDAKHRGKIEIDFYGLDDLERILQMLRR